jgi:hypothetical protein
MRKRKAPAYRRQAQDKPAKKVFFTFWTDWLDLEPMSPVLRKLDAGFYTFLSK